MTMKKLSYLFPILIPVIFMIISACSSGSDQKTKKPEATVQKESAAPTQTVSPNELASQLARGEQIYKEKCIACHQANGQGLPNAFPSLTGSKFLLENKVLAVSQVLNGSANVKANRTVKYPAPMPPQLDNKEDAVAVINYVLNNFGNNGGHVTMDDVKDVVVMPR
jgi:nitrite reductase (NO-forming)